MILGADEEGRASQRRVKPTLLGRVSHKYPRNKYTTKQGKKREGEERKGEHTLGLAIFTEEGRIHHESVDCALERCCWC
jgi:hypothetical protein